ncbi:hypothetical protein [Haloechinothrix halophila]|uniref:hypothetical protein n=1 Tax=Haloechinothrix halophila TaxID=1069073 RepID=UPI00146F9A8B|nr:hypothetical protein [Haloechinothrix halophila]
MSTVKEPETWQQLIADCADIPRTLNPHPAVILPRAAPQWEVDEKCEAQVADLDEYV